MPWPGIALLLLAFSAIVTVMFLLALRQGAAVDRQIDERERNRRRDSDDPEA